MAGKDEAVLLMLKGAISDLPPDERAKIEKCVEDLNTTIKNAGDAGLIAFSLIAAAMAASAEK